MLYEVITHAPGESARADMPQIAVAVLHQFATACHLNIQIGDLFAQGIARNNFV